MCWRLRVRAWLFLAGLCAALDRSFDRRGAVISDQPASLRCLKQPIAHLLFVETATGNDLKQIKRGGIERGVARARLGGGDALTLTIECCPRPRLRLRGLGERDQPRRRQSGILRSPRFPLIRSPGGVPARRQADVTAVAAHIDPRTDLARAVPAFDV